MLKVYVVALCAGVLVLLAVIFTGSIRAREGGDWFDRLRVPLGGVLGFAIGGVAAEYSPLDLSWPMALILAVVGGTLGVVWVRYATREDAARDDVP